MPQSFVSLHAHIVFSTKDWRPFITDDMETRLHEYLGGIVRADGGCLLAAGGTPEHIHLLISLSKQIAMADAVRTIKSNTSKWIHETFPAKRVFAWQPGYGGFAVSFSNLDAVKRYIVNQAEHHRKTTAREEFIALLKRHEIDFDERYL